MNKVTTINLNGRAYQVEEAGYELLRKYLDEARAQLEGNPDKDEIMGDFEQAIGEKCGNYLNAGKDVITTAEIEAIIAKMGPVDAGGAGAEHQHGTGSTSASTTGKPRRLYRIVEGEWIAGVANGLGAYFNLDTSLIRVIFVILGLLTHGFMIAVYIILAIVMPVARTEEERERARGQAPFTANEFIEQAKQRYAEFQKNHPNAPATPADPLNKDEWRKWKEEMKQWKHEFRADRHAEKARRHAERWSARRDARQYGVGFAGSGFFRFILGLMIAALFIIWAVALTSIISSGIAFGFPLAAAHPLWIAIVFITALLYVLVLPLKLLMKNSRPQRWGHYSFFSDIVQSIFFIFALYLLLYTAQILFPAVHEAWGIVLTSLRAM